MDEQTRTPDQVTADRATRIEIARQRVRDLLEICRPQMALQEAHQLVALAPDMARARYLMGICYLRLEQYEYARQCALQTLGLDPGFAPAHWLAAQTALMESRYAEGLQAIAQALALDPSDPDYYSTQAALLLDSGKPRDALAVADAGLRIDPEHAACGRVRTLALLNLGRLKEADAEALADLARHTDDETSWYIRGEQLLRTGRAKEARAAFLESLRLNPEDHHAQDGLQRAIGASNPFFALIFRWWFFMIRFPPAVQWGIIVGLVVIHRMFRVIAQTYPVLAPVMGAFSILYMLFCIYTWVAGPLFKFAVRKGWIR